MVLQSANLVVGREAAKFKQEHKEFVEELLSNNCLMTTKEKQGTCGNSLQDCRSHRQQFRGPCMDCLTL